MLTYPGISVHADAEKAWYANILRVFQFMLILRKQRHITKIPVSVSTEHQYSDDR